MAETKLWGKEKPHKSGLFNVQKVGRGRSLYGEIHIYPTGVQEYWALRKPDEVFIKTNSWAIDKDTVQFLRTKKITKVGVLVSNGDTYVTDIATLYTTDKMGGYSVEGDFSNHIGFKRKRGALQYYLPIPHWLFTPGDSVAKVKHLKSIASSIHIR